MSQKIVITANVKREPQVSEPSVSYEWHWRRIVSISMLVIMTSAAVIYGLSSAVNADQGAPHPNEQLDFTEQQTAIVSLSDDTAASAESENATDADEEPLSSVAIAAPKILSPDEQKPAPITEQVTTEPEVQQSIIEQEVEPTLTAEPEEAAMAATDNQTPETETASEKQAEQKVFAESAQVASVAIGAKIDTATISRAVLTRSVSNREPTNVFAADVRLSQFEESLSFFSELKNLQGQQVKHIWLFEGEVMAEVSLKVTSPRYRTYSTKNIMDSQLGNWRVDVVDERGLLIAQKEFRILAD
ncbi:hypothetical protein PTE01_31570 [Pseudoalteromonas tetraodonis GFC]|uniref:DUF2914 domain-containing protein n=1 Tax=Pseudoalteromonas tetraodonis GFC TaxID=1315271 RepID=A0AA37S3R2_9GAMM|nr:DUF2914 domain-containing protein [Pseudoalteromonas tetraodonis]ATD01707.1 hypothetical protein PTET_a0108 [Pseudoalteromonas tetraodonis]GEN40047.1 hypothetical protein PTE01_31570 [Pseudoalteromonas tetraodonis GFC]GLQ03742.1 hypothetical protein GCM10007914_26230 [Pseudoalteromonas tetraodonis GFC]